MSRPLPLAHRSAPGESRAVSTQSLESLAALLHARQVLLLTGAGLSTASGIPDYRGPDSPPRRRPPVQHREFVGSATLRARYWARSTLGWPRFRGFQPNPAHHAIADWERTGQLGGIVTQNVDRLHHKAGSVDTIELHGALERVRCLGCDAIERRDAIQERIVSANPEFLSHEWPLLPDGDVELPEALVTGFVVPACLACGGILKPDVVFFGDHVPPPTLHAAFSRLDDADALLVLGSSLHVFSGYRFALRAAEQRKPIAIVNRGETRADPLATVKLDADVTLTLPALLQDLGVSATSGARTGSETLRHAR